MCLEEHLGRMRIAFKVIAALLVVALIAIAAQEYRYAKVRHDIVVDRQSIFHSSSVFHVVTLLALSTEQELLSAVRSFADVSKDVGGQIIYAGKVFQSGSSRQVPYENWDAFILVQFPSQDAYAKVAEDSVYQKARTQFASSYAHGMQRSAIFNLSIPIVLLSKRVMDYVTFTPNRYPFEFTELSEDVPAEVSDQRDVLLERLSTNREYGRDAVVILNFHKEGDASERESMDNYGDAMFDLMAESGNGPMHFGHGITVEGEAIFDNVIIVYYPGVDYLAEMLQSKYFLGIIGGKRVGDAMGMLSVPLLPHL
jgi:hypothetical protein|tara:strand:- start:4937 stop:5869 length:933 start_codon:yes stop_codon:yes gene_type:complete